MRRLDPAWLASVATSAIKISGPAVRASFDRMDASVVGSAAVRTANVRLCSSSMA